MKMLYILIIFTAVIILIMSDIDIMTVLKKDNTNEKTERDLFEPPNGQKRGSLRAVIIR